MMNAMIEPSIFIWNKNELTESLENEELKNKYFFLQQELILLIQFLEEDRPEYLLHKIYLRPELIEILLTQISLLKDEDIERVLDSSLHDLRTPIYSFLANQFEDYPIDTGICYEHPILSDYYDEQIREEVMGMYHYAIHSLKDVTIFGLKESSFYTVNNLQNQPKEISFNNPTNSSITKINYFDTIDSLNHYFNVQYTNKNYQGVLKTGTIMVFGSDCIKKYYDRLTRKYVLSPKHSPFPIKGKRNAGTHIFLDKNEANTILQEAIWDESRSNSHFLYAVVELYGELIIHAFPTTNVVDNTYHGYPICEENIYIYLQDEFRKLHPNYSKRSTWQNDVVSNQINLLLKKI